ncbi:MAG: hypothetical protein IT369_22215, partial [Candidatus Latescibacteria bacterium]|nr:hypothetical protein [Candidatus Latescibacterota bacterium]
QYVTANGTATAGSDYTAATGTLSFAAGETSKTVAVSITGDLLSEADETFTLNLSGATNATIADAQGLGTLTNDDATPSLSVNDVTAAEGNSGTSTLTFAVTLSAASGQTVTVSYATANGTATSGSDYTAATGTLTFVPGDLSKTVAVTVSGDLITEPNETLTLNLSSAANATISDAQGVGTLTNDDATPGASVNDAAISEGNSGSTVLSFVVTLSNPSSSTVLVQYVTANGTATAGSDYTAATGTLTFAAGETSKAVAVSITGDLLSEADETFTLNLSGATSATITRAQGLGTITNDDAAPGITVNDVSANEGNSGTSTLTFTLTLSNASTSAITVAYATANGTATSGSDYTAASGTLTFNAGETSKTVAISIAGDALSENDETINLNLSNPTNATIADAQGIGTLINDDASPSLTINDVSVAEGNSGTKSLTFTATLSTASGRSVTVLYATANGTATSGSDYTAASGTLTFNAGVTAQTVAITITGDATNEADETFTVNLSSPSGATISDGQGIGTLTNDDAVPTISVNDVTVTEGNSGTTAMNFTVSLSAVSGQTVTVAYATANGAAPGSSSAALAGSDFTAASGILTIAAGQASATIAVSVTGDLTFEPTETMTINLSNATNGSIADPQGAGTITNDDVTPTIAVNDVSVNEGNSGTTAMNFTVSLSNPSSSVITVAYATANGTATSGSDYTAANNTLTFVAGETSKTVAVSITGDVLNEANETINLNLSSAANATIADAQGVGTLTNDDALPGLSINDVSTSEANSGTKTMTFTVTLSPVSGQTVTVNYATANVTASAPGDYTAISGTLTYTAGQTSKTIVVTTVGDRTIENNETFAVNLSSATNATLTDAQGIGTISNNDAKLVAADNLIGEGRFGVANYPNPFNPSTEIVYNLIETAPVRLAVYNALGHRIRVLVAEVQLPGSYEVQWDGRDEAGQPVGAGWYLYRLEAGTRAATGRMSLVK